MVDLVGMRGTRTRLLAQVLFWFGFATLLAGFVHNRMWNDVPWSEATLLAWIAIAVALAALLLKRVTGAALATSAGLLWLLALAYYAGFTSIAAVALLAVGGLALGSWFVPAEWPARAALSIVAGLALISGLIGWLLPFPVHGRTAYFVALLILVLARWRVIAEVLQPMPQVWRGAVASAPFAMWLAVMAAGVGSTCAWLPTVHYDDLAGHLALPSQLVELGYYRMDPASSLWALSAWAADVLQGVAWLFAGHESRGAMDVLWWLLGLTLIWRLGEVLDLPPWLRCAAVALYASLPLTAGSLTGMQTEGPTAALAAGIALLIQRSTKPDRRQLLVFALLFGLMLSLKVSNLMIAGPLGLWLLCHWRGCLPWSSLPAAGALLLLVAGSSYAYGWILAGNPVLPVFNSVFHSPYYTPTNFHDTHWDAGFHWDILWNLVFHTSRYVEGGNGTAGFVLIALGGCLLETLLDRRTRPLALVALGSFLLPLSQIQYLRYAHQALVLLIPVMLCAVAVIARSPGGQRRVAAGLIVLGIVNLTFISVGDWQLKTGELGQFLKQSRHDFMERYAPVNQLIEVVNQRYGATARVLFTSSAVPYAAGFAGRAFVVNWYDQALSGLAAQAEQDVSGGAWEKVWADAGVNLLILQTGHVSQALASALTSAQTRLILQEGDLQLWEVRRNISGVIQQGASRDAFSVKFDTSTLPTGPTLVRAELALSCEPQGLPIAMAWRIARRGAEPWIHYSWANCLPNGTAPAVLELAMPSELDGFTVSAHSATETPMRLGLISSALQVRPDLSSERDLAHRLRRQLPATLASWIDPRSGDATLYSGTPLAAPARGVAANLDTRKAPTQGSLVYAQLKLKCHFSDTPIVVGWKAVEVSGAEHSRYAWSFCARDGTATALYDTKVKRKLRSLVVDAVPDQGADMDLKLIDANVRYLRKNGWRGILNRKRVRLADWLRPGGEAPRVMQ
jgi:hypothetical protein